MNALATPSLTADSRTAAAPGASPAVPLQSGAAPSRRAVIAGRILSGLGVAFLAFDATLKLSMAAEAVKGTVDLGYPAEVIRPLGVLQVVCLALYLFPRTAVLGAIFWTGYLGGAVATHLRLGNPLFSHLLFPLYVAAFLWLGLWLRDVRVRALLPWRAR